MPVIRTPAPLQLPGIVLVLLVSVTISVIVCLLALSLGSTSTSLVDVIGLLFGDDGGLPGRIVNEIRLPRVLAGFCVGGMLALAGCLMQVLLRNPLAEPYILGVSGGAAVFALLAIILGIQGLGVNLSSFAGALVSILLVFVLARRGGYWSALRTLLTGVVLAAGWGALISFLLAITPAQQVHGMLFWLMGDLSFAVYTPWNMVLLVVALFVAMLLGRTLNLLASGEVRAASLGLAVGRYNIIIYFLASLLTAAAVMQAGSIGFVGLVVPHLARLLIGNDHRLLLPVSVMLGGSLLVLADALARSIMAPQQLPVGVLTAMLGVPVFLLLLQTVFRERQS